MLEVELFSGLVWLSCSPVSSKPGLLLHLSALGSGSITSILLLVCPQLPRLRFHSCVRTEKEGGYSKFFQKREDTSLPEIPQQSQSAGLLPSPDAITPSREWEPMTSVGTSDMSPVSSQQWSLLPPVSGLRAGGMSISVNVKAVKGNGDNTSWGVGRGQGGVYAN